MVTYIAETLHSISEHSPWFYCLLVLGFSPVSWIHFLPLTRLFVWTAFLCLTLCLFDYDSGLLKLHFSEHEQYMAINIILTVFFKIHVFLFHFIVLYVCRGTRLKRKVHNKYSTYLNLLIYCCLTY